MEETKQLTKAQIRAKKYYESHKAIILEKAKLKRANKNATSIVVVKEVVEIKKRPVYNFSDVLFVVENDIHLKDTTRQIYVKSLRRINKLLQYDNYMDLDKTDDTIKIINDATQFSVNTIKLIYQTILKVIDLMELDIDKKNYIKQFELFKIKSIDENKVKQETMPTISFDKYLKMVQSQFGIDSKMYLLALFYDFITLRDDFSNLIIVDKVSDITADVDKNYIFVPSKGLCILRINSYKTDKKYGVIHKNLSVPISDMVRRYIKNNTMNNGDFLFGRNVGNYISVNNKLLNPEFEGINFLRHIKVSDLLNKSDVTPEEKLSLSMEMKHSPIVQSNYKRA